MMKKNYNYIEIKKFSFFLEEQLLDSISAARDLIRTKLMEPHKVSSEKKMIDLIDDQINHKYSKFKSVCTNFNGGVELIEIGFNRCSITG